MDESRSESYVVASGSPALGIGEFMAFADAGNLDHCTMDLNEKLAAFGLPAPLDLVANEPVSIARTCNCIYSLLQQKQLDIEFRESSNEQRLRLQSDISRSEAKVEILEAQIASKDRELAILTQTEATTTEAFKTQIDKLQKERDEFQNMAIDNQKGPPRRTRNKMKAGGDFYKMIVDACEFKQRELMSENVDLWSLLGSMQMGMHGLLVAPNELPEQNLSVEEEEDAESLQSPLGGRTDAFDLIFSMARDQIEESLQTKMASIKKARMGQQDAQNGTELASESTEGELEGQLVEARSIVEELAHKNRIEDSGTQEDGGKYLEATENENKGIEDARIQYSQIEDPRNEDMEQNMAVDTSDYVGAQGSDFIMAEDQSQYPLSEQFEMVTEYKEVTEFHDHTMLFTTDKVFESRDQLKQWADELGRINGSVLVISKSDHSHSGRTPRLQIGCERGGKYRKHKKGESSESESSDRIVKKRKAGSKKCECPFLLKGIHMAGNVDKWRVWVESGHHNHPLLANLEGHSFAGRLSNDEMLLVAEMTKSGVKPQKILDVIKEMNPQNVSTARHIYNARAKIRSSADLGGSRDMDQWPEIIHTESSANDTADVIDNDVES